MRLILANVPSVICLVGAIVMMFHQVDGWGWLLVVALLLSHTYGEVKK